MADKLTDKQRRFVEEYTSNGFNATKAAIAAGYKESAARQTASETLSKPYIQDAIQEFMSIAAKRAIVTVEDVVKGLHREAMLEGEGSTQSGRVAAWKALSEYTGGFDANKQKVEISAKEELTPWSGLEIDVDE